MMPLAILLLDLFDLLVGILELGSLSRFGMIMSSMPIETPALVASAKPELLQLIERRQPSLLGRRLDSNAK